MARSKIKHFKKWSLVEGDIRVTLNMSRFEKQFQQAQYGLDSAVMTSMIPFMPHQNGTFIQNTARESASVAGSGKVYAAFGPQGRYLYEGKVMVNRKTGKGPGVIPDVGPRWRKGDKLVETDRPLQYTKTHNPKAQSHWFDAAKEKDGKKWVKKVKKTAGGGKRG